MLALTALTLGLLLGPHQPHHDGPATGPEASAGRRTTLLAEAQAFLGELGRLSHADRVRVGTFGESEEGRPLLLVGTALQGATLDGAEARASAGLRVLVVGNIHAGEVEGKEAVLQLIREVAQGEHAPLLEGAHVWFAPIYNVDGNERISKGNRVEQNGPEEGVGQRPNASGLDLNRDFVKAEAKETRALLALMDRFDPHVVLDLHTTDGSYHGYHLTYATSLAVNVDRELDRFARTRILDAARRTLLSREGIRAFDYGNVMGRAPRRWVTYDHRPRFGTNMIGLRGRVAVLSEAYSYLPFAERIAVTRAFVLAVLEAAQSSRAELFALLERVDERARSGAPLLFGDRSELVAPRLQSVLLGAVDEVPLEGLGTRRVARGEWREAQLGVQDRFVAGRVQLVPAGWLIPEPTDEDKALLAIHGLPYRLLEQERALEVLRFRIQTSEQAERLFQGHHERRLEGDWEAASLVAPVGALYVDARHARVRVMAQLLEPESEDGLVTWNHFDGRLAETFPVVRVRAPLDLSGSSR